ncbi:MAG: PDZ domain-containing protein [Erysipelotrichaceae bacterium]|nr:PDZ domain-containing protein [Erysipelotrichaceae bacterium]
MPWRADWWTDVSADSMAAKAGLLVGDVITKINDIDMDSYQTYREWMYHNAEKQLTLEVHRGLDTLKLILTVEEPPVAETVND